MADFCKQCSIDDFGIDHRDHAWDRGKKLDPDHGWSVICEGCGFILVNDEGECIRCSLMKGRPGHDGNPIAYRTLPPGETP